MLTLKEVKRLDWLLAKEVVEDNNAEEWLAIKEKLVEYALDRYATVI